MQSKGFLAYASAVCRVCEGIIRLANEKTMHWPVISLVIEIKGLTFYWVEGIYWFQTKFERMIQA